MALKKAKNCARAHWIFDHLTQVPDFPREGVNFLSCTPLLGNPSAFKSAISLWTERYHRFGKPDVIAGIDSRGFHVDQRFAMTACTSLAVYGLERAIIVAAQIDDRVDQPVNGKTVCADRGGNRI